MAVRAGRGPRRRAGIRFIRQRHRCLLSFLCHDLPCTPPHAGGRCHRRLRRGQPPLPHFPRPLGHRPTRRPVHRRPSARSQRQHPVPAWHHAGLHVHRRRRGESLAPVRPALELGRPHSPPAGAASHEHVLQRRRGFRPACRGPFLPSRGGGQPAALPRRQLGRRGQWHPYRGLARPPRLVVALPLARCEQLIQPRVLLHALIARPIQRESARRRL